MAARFEERIESYVEQQLENAFSGGQPQIPTKLALGGLGIAFASILMMVAVVVVIVLAGEGASSSSDEFARRARVSLSTNREKEA